MILITGATGLVGRTLVAELTSRGAGIRAVTRTAGAGTLPAAVEVFVPIWPGPRVSPALEGVDTLFVHPRAVGGNAEKLLALAAEREAYGESSHRSACRGCRPGRPPAEWSPTDCRRLSPPH
jgi:uncharacterized protein YbjT (DUF2867 family)